ncbi:MAG: hypothetical protein ACKPKO_18285, partial [Candidatus Fonsibacter sp.]
GSSSGMLAHSGCMGDGYKQYSSNLRARWAKVESLALWPMAAGIVHVNVFSMAMLHVFSNYRRNCFYIADGED